MSPTAVRLTGWTGIAIIFLLNLLVLVFIGSQIYGSHYENALVIQAPKDVQQAFEAYKQRADNVQTLVTTLIGLSSLYALALGFTSFLTAQQYLRTFEETETKFQKQFPLFKDIEGSLQELLTQLAFLSQPLMVDFEDIDDVAWGRVRQKIMFYETAFAGFDLLESPVYRNKIIDVFRYLCRFYRKNYEKPRYRQNDDLDRALFYAEIAVGKSGRRYTMLNNLATTWIDVAASGTGIRDAYQKARELLEESWAKRPRQQCALYRLAWIDDEEGDLPSAVRRLRQALPIPVWEDGPDRLQSAVPYNLGCALTKLAATGRDRERNLDESVELLKIALSAEAALRDNFERDLAADGDLRFLLIARPWQVGEIRSV